MVQELAKPGTIQDAAAPLLESLKNEGVYQDAIARAISDRIIETAQEIGSSARQEMEGIDWATEILSVVANQGFSEGLQQRLDDLGALGEVVGLRIQLALVVYTNELATLQEESEKLTANQKEALKLEVEKRWEINRNGRLTRIQFLLTIFSLWPLLLGVPTLVGSGFIGGAIWHQQQVSQRSK
jgi:hypothetical protein